MIVVTHINLERPKQNIKLVIPEIDDLSKPSLERILTQFYFGNDKVPTSQQHIIDELKEMVERTVVNEEFLIGTLRQDDFEVLVITRVAM